MLMQLIPELITNSVYRCRDIQEVGGPDIVVENDEEYLPAEVKVGAVGKKLNDYSKVQPL